MNTSAAPTTSEADLISRLPAGFRRGVATSAYQIEGAVDADGRTPSIWDTFCRVPGAVHEGDTGDVACEHYTRMPADVALIKDLGMDTYRFSVSWSRVQPHGTGGVNPAGIAFYTGDKFPAWKGNLFIAGMRMGETPRTGHIQRVVFNEKWESVRNEMLLLDLHQRIRDVAQGPDGYLYAITDEGLDSVLLKIEPGPEK